MAQIIWTEPALYELDKIAEYIAIDNFLAAQRLVQSVFARVEQLKDHSQSGRKVPELPTGSVYREVIVGPVRVFYRVDSQQIIIIRIMRSERVLRQFMLESRANLRS